jgi:hypothetical protein
MAPYKHPVFLAMLHFAVILCSCNARPMAQSSNESFARGDSLLDQILRNYHIADSSSYLHAWYHSERSLECVAMAEEAEALFREALKSTSERPDFSIECLRKLALSFHFQTRDFSYQDSLPANYHAAMGYMEQAIKAQKGLPPSPKLAELYECQARIAIPHFFFGYQGGSSSKAEAHAYGILNQAAATYLQLGDKRSALRVMRDIKDNTADFTLRKIALAREVEGGRSLTLANDIMHLMHNVMYQSIAVQDTALLDEYIALAVEIYDAQQGKGDGQPDAKDDVPGSLRNLLGSSGYYYKFRRHDPAKALGYYLKAQAIEESMGWDVYYNAFYIGGIHIEAQQWDLATEQFDKALKDKRLSPTDREHAYFGKAFVAYLKGFTMEATAIWRESIGNKQIMNGISSFAGNFSPEKRGYYRAKALELISLVDAPNARRIVMEGWTD